jgi:hypothetical protein
MTDDEEDFDDEELFICAYCGMESNELGVFECDCAEQGLGEVQRCEYCGDEVQGVDHSNCVVTEDERENED